MEHLLIPAVVPYVFWHHEVAGMRLPTYWLDPTFPEIYYPAVLLSATYWRALKDVATIKSFGPGCVVFGDSGGYSVVTKDEPIDPEVVIRWQIAHCTRGVTLDIPPYRSTGGSQFGGTASEYWKNSIKRTRLNVKRSLPYYLDDKGGFRWWGVIQGETNDQMEEWYDTLTTLYPFDKEGEGWALAPKPSIDLFTVVRHLRFAHQKGLRNVHLLQVTSARLVGAVLALSEMAGTIDLVTYDSASAALCAINRNAITPDSDGWGMKFIRQQGMEGIVEDFIMACTCQYCQWFQEYRHLVDNRAYTHYLVGHNHEEMVRCFDRVYEFATSDPVKCLKWATKDSHTYGKVLRVWDGSHDPGVKSQVRGVSLKARIGHATS